MKQGIGIWAFFTEEERASIDVKSFRPIGLWRNSESRDKEGYCPLGRVMNNGTMVPEAYDILDYLIAQGRVDKADLGACRYVLAKASDFIHDFDEGYINIALLKSYLGQE